MQNANDTNDNNNESSDLTNDDVGNKDPSKDIANSFDYVDSNYDRENPTWQENANRYLETLDADKTKLEGEKTAADTITSDKEIALRDYINKNNLSKEACESDPQYQELRNECTQAKDHSDSIDSK